MTDSYWEWNLATKQSYMSPQFWNMFGYSPESIDDEIKKWNEMIFPEDLITLKQNLKKHFKTKGQHQIKQEIRCRHRNGSIVWVVCVGKVIEWSDEGRPVRMIGTHTDVTQIKKIQKNLDNNLRLAALGEMAGSISHEINNPLAIINISLDWLSKVVSQPNFDVEKVVTKIQTAKKNITRASSIIEGLKLYTGNLHNELRKEHKASRIMDITLSLLASRIDKHHIEVINQVDSDLTLYCDESQISYVFHSLISNSIDALNGGFKKRLEVSSTVIDGQAVIRFTDTGGGPGLAQSATSKEHPLLSTTISSGSRLGLSVSKSILENHMGSLELVNNSKTTVFEIRLPMSAAKNCAA